MAQIIFFQKYELQEVYIIILITIPIVISAALSAFFSLLSTWMFIVAAKESEFDKIVRIAYKILLIMIPMVILLHFLGFIDDYILVKNGMVRHSLGFSHPNVLGLQVFQLVACHCYINRKKIRVIDLIYLLIAVLFVYFVPSQTSYICMAVLFLVLIINMIINKCRKIFLDIYMNCLFALTILFNFFSVLWSFIGVEWSPILIKINNFLSGRFSWCHKVFQIYGVSFWGQRIYVSTAERSQAGLSTYEKLYLDNAYMTLILITGIISYVVFILLYYISMMYFEKRKYTVLFIIFTTYALYGVMERGLFLTTNNIFLVGISNVVFGKEILEIPIKRKRKITIKF